MHGMERNTTEAMDSHESPDSKMESRLEEGKTLMNDGVYPAALGPLMKAINLCSCNPASHGKDKSCNISQCILAIQDTDPDALYRVATGRCSCHFAWPFCTRPLHLQAVDTLAECLEKTGHYAPAFSTALGLIRLDPASAIGYCRIIRIIRYLVKHHQGADQYDARSISALLRDARLPSLKKLRDMVDLFAKCGLHNTEKYRHSPDDKYHVILRQIAYNRNLPEARKDPLTKLPREIIGLILSYVNTTTLIRCCRVSKSWRRVIEPDDALWSRIRLKQPKSSRYFAKFLQRHREVRSLLFDDVTRLSFGSSHLRSIVLLPKLRHLYIAIGNRRELKFEPGLDIGNLGGPGIDPIQREHTARLTRLSLVFDGSANFKTWESLLNFMSPDLEVLDLVPGPKLQIGLKLNQVSPFPKLKKLRLDCHNCQSSAWIESYPKVPMTELARNTPNLEYLYLDGLQIDFNNVGGFETHPDKLRYWQSLRSLTIGTACSLPQETVFALPFLPSTLQVLELFSKPPFVAETILSGVNPSSEHVELLNSALGNSALGYSAEEFQSPNLEVFRCRALLPPYLLRRVLEPAVQSGSLKVLELGGLDFAGSTSTPLTDEYHFAASDHIHTLGMYRFNWADMGSPFNGIPFLDWLKLFPNVKTVTAYPGAHSNTSPFFMKLICHPGIEVVHQDQLRGVEWDEAQELAKKHGVKLCHTPNNTPIGWPILD